ncbi:SDR family NAD(P)-dependent oxidoreductase [Methylobacterium komagatae]|uniref:SDR family NAD(P)-dependent oxidoreductase n=1 Tax=Methylobacterium komagatae TaxID=374425 RepID=A0ABW2BK81_9HYPH
MSTKPILALVSGANRGIGLAIATGLARQGAQVLLGCRDIGKGEAACNALRAEGLQVRPVELDTTSTASVSRLAEMIQQGYGYLDALVNNAGIGVDHDPMLTAADRLRRTMSVNVLGPLLLTDAMAPLLSASGRGRIVNVSSELASFGLRANPNWAFADFPMPIYQASKAALNSLTLSYARQPRTEESRSTRFALATRQQKRRTSRARGRRTKRRWSRSAMRCSGKTALRAASRTIRANSLGNRLAGWPTTIALPMLVMGHSAAARSSFDRAVHRPAGAQPLTQAGR